MNMDYNLYKIFLYLYEERSISKTANKLYVSQPAISYSLKELENSLGYTLFTRNSKGIGGDISILLLYGGAAFVGLIPFLSSTIYQDLIIWAGWCGLCALIAFINLITYKPQPK